MKVVVQRPAAKEGGREEEESRSGISAGVAGCLHDKKTVPACAASLYGLRRRMAGGVIDPVARSSVPNAKLCKVIALEY
jgi:hypothetical protein